MATNQPGPDPALGDLAGIANTTEQMLNAPTLSALDTLAGQRNSYFENALSVQPGSTPSGAVNVGPPAAPTANAATAPSAANTTATLGTGTTAAPSPAPITSLPGYAGLNATPQEQQILQSLYSNFPNYPSPAAALDRFTNLSDWLRGTIPT